MRTGVPITLALILMTIFCGKALARHGESRPVRVTLGSVEQRNWENNLVKRNPNLAHYHWNPIYANVQGTQMVRPMPKNPIRGTAPGKKRLHGVSHGIFKPAYQRPSVYKKPVHMAPQRTASTSSEYRHAQLPTGSMNRVSTNLEYKHAQLPVARRDASGRLIAPPTSSQDTAAQLRNPRVAASLRPNSQSGRRATAKELSIPGNKAVSAQLAQKSTSAQLASHQVSAELMARSTEARLVSPKTLTYGRYSSGASSVGVYEADATVTGRVASGTRNF